MTTNTLLLFVRAQGSGEVWQLDRGVPTGTVLMGRLVGMHLLMLNDTLKALPQPPHS